MKQYKNDNIASFVYYGKLEWNTAYCIQKLACE